VAAFAARRGVELAELTGNMEDGGFLAVCLCAEWCKTCREYRPGFEALASRFPAMGFRWVDIEDHADEMGDLDITDFPTLLIFRGARVLFFGVTRPQPRYLARLLETFAAQTLSEARDYAISSPERASWQQNDEITALRRWILSE
jgi:thiol-disulfide isomerase/thioredoxin